MKAEVSIIIAAYNIESYITRCIESVINQTFKNIEIIVVDDGSTDNTLRILNKFKEMDNRISLVTQENKGSIEARKIGFSYSTGEYILFVDGDDWLELKCIEKLYNKANAENKDVVLFNFFWSYDDNRKLGNAFNSKKKDILVNPLKSLFIGDIAPSLWTKFIKREYIIKNNISFPSNISFAEDLATVSSLFISKPDIGILKDNLYNYYQRNDSITKQISPKILEVNKAILFIKDKLLEDNIYNDFKKEFEIMLYSHLFVQRFLTANTIEEIHKQVYKQYKQYRINIKNNNYIKEFIKNQPLSLRIRMKTYNKNYYLGRSYDFIRNILELHKNKVFVSKRKKI